MQQGVFRLGSGQELCGSGLPVAGRAREVRAASLLTVGYVESRWVTPT